VIAGQRIADSERKSWGCKCGFEGPLGPIKRRPSGSMGFVDFRNERVGLNPFNCSALYVAFLGVEPEHVEKGVGRCLMEGVENIARMRGASKVHGDIYDLNKLDSTGFFKKLGYEIERKSFYKIL
jgi:GNAT superfamily N-acetyltransferase